ncbi:MAG: hypothetical protein QGG40_12965 [Myxococcota bacterium]|jgi:hypothetical protein|nr:hypothetical protein [Myxococcota bacterium]
MDESRNRQDLIERARDGLQPVRFLLGSWEGDGQSFGEPLHGTLEAHARFEDTVIEVRETLYRTDGTLEHEDLCLYRLDSSGTQLLVAQVMAPGWLTDQPVTLQAGGLFWSSGPLTPRAHLRREGDDLVEEVWFPDRDEPDVWLRFHRRAVEREENS